MSLRNLTATVKRYSGQTTWLDGKPVNSAYDADIIIKCSVQPLSGRELMNLPEGRRNRESFNLFTSTKLNTVEDRNPDKIVVLGDTYEVVNCERWRNQIISHYKAVIQKI